MKEQNEKQAIEEMVKDVTEAIKHNSAVDVIRHGLICVNGDGIARELFDDGYRKQNAWISVDERLPERNGRYLTHCKIEGQSLVCILYYCKVGGFNEGTVTHWMPLPEPPKGAGNDKNNLCLF